MSDLMALEILGGPMDGVRLDLSEMTEAAKIGRQVGNHLTLPYDMTISRWHATIEKHGPDFYLKDENSVSGTWINGARIEKVLIEPGLIFLVGGTIIEVLKQELSEGNVGIGENSFKHPKDIYPFSSRFSDVLNSLFKKENIKNYGSITGIIQQPLFYNLKQMSAYKCIQRITAFDTRSVLSDWINQSEIKPSYRFSQPDTVLISPRLWRIFDLASQENTRKITISRFLRALLKEKRSLPARIIQRDREFVRDFKSGFKIPDKPREKPEKEKPERIEPVLFNTLIEFESIINGFIEDALHSGMLRTGSGIKDKGFSLTAAYQKQDNRALKSALQRIEKKLVGVLAAHREANRLFEKKIFSRINEVLLADAAKNKGLFSGADADKSLSRKVRAVLKESELEGLADQIVRQTIKNKIMP